VQPEGKVVGGGCGKNGANDDFALGRYKTDGSLDKTFGGTGKITTPIGSGDDVAEGLVRQPDGNLVAAGYSDTGPTSSQFALVRYLGIDQCVVPKVKGKTLTAAKRAIRKAGCSVGKVTKAFSGKVKKGRVIS